MFSGLKRKGTGSGAGDSGVAAQGSRVGSVEGLEVPWMLMSDGDILRYSLKSISGGGVFGGA